MLTLACNTRPAKTAATNPNIYWRNLSKDAQESANNSKNLENIKLCKIVRS